MLFLLYRLIFTLKMIFCWRISKVLIHPVRSIYSRPSWERANHAKRYARTSTRVSVRDDFIFQRNNFSPLRTPELDAIFIVYAKSRNREARAHSDPSAMVRVDS